MVTAGLGLLSCGQTRLSPIGIFAPGDGRDATVPDAPGEAASGDALLVIPPCPDTLEGYATTATPALPNGTTGGAAGPIVTASSADELQAFAAMDVPLVIQISALIPVVPVTPVMGEIRVHADKTIEGVSPGAGLVGGGFTVLDTDNVIIRRLTISKVPYPFDAVTVQNSHHVWIDHCDLSSDRLAPANTYDGLVDITHASDDVTVSWNIFHDHDRPSLVGHSNSPTAMAEDVGHLIVTYHHNWFHDVNTNTPRVRFGTVHVYDNLYESISGAAAIISQENATVLVEGNVFNDVAVPITTVYSDPVQGFVASRNNRCLTSCGGDDIRLPKDWPVPPTTYPYTLDTPAEITPAFVRKCAGPSL